MGWMFRNKTTKAELIADLKQRYDRAGLDPESSVEALEHAVVGNNLWTLLRSKGEASRTSILLTLIQGGKDEWGYKMIDEASSPNEYNCPIRMLRKSTEPSDAWRKFAFLKQGNMEAIKKMPRPGLEVTNEYATTGTVKTYVLVNKLEGQKGWKVQDAADGQYYRIELDTLTELNAAAIENKAEKMYLAHCGAPDVVPTPFQSHRIPEVIREGWVAVALGLQAEQAMKISHNEVMSRLNDGHEDRIDPPPVITPSESQGEEPDGGVDDLPDNAPARSRPMT